MGGHGTELALVLLSIFMLACVTWALGAFRKEEPQLQIAVAPRVSQEIIKPAVPVIADVPPEPSPEDEEVRLAEDAFEAARSRLREVRYSKENAAQPTSDGDKELALREFDNAKVRLTTAYARQADELF